MCSGKARSVYVWLCGRPMRAVMSTKYSGTDLTVKSPEPSRGDIANKESVLGVQTPPTVPPRSFREASLGWAVANEEYQLPNGLLQDKQDCLQHPSETSPKRFAIFSCHEDFMMVLNQSVITVWPELPSWMAEAAWSIGYVN
ncbi:hypothetical protein STEG23_027819 [Scotinomys teguina]